MKLFSPVIRLLNRLKYSQKFFVIGLVLLVPLLVVCWLYLQTINDDMKQISKKIEGANYNVALKDVLQNTQQSGGLNVSLSTGNTSVKDEIEKSEENINAALVKLWAIEADITYDFQTTKKLKEIQGHWDTLQQTEWKNPIDVQIEYDKINRNIINLMTDVANHSELLLATSKEGFNLIYNTTVELPTLTEQLVQMRSIGTDILNSGVVVKAQQDALNSLFYPMNHTMQEMQGTMALTFHNKELAAAIQSEYDALNDNVEQFTAVAGRLTDDSLTTIEYLNVATAAMDANYEFYTASLATVVSILEKQYKDLSGEALEIFLMLVLIFLVALFLFICLYIAIRQSIKSLAEVTAEVANGNLGIEVSLQTKDEMKNIETAFNSMTDQLNNLIREISVSAEHVSSSSEELQASAELATVSVDHASKAVSKMAVATELQATSLKESTQAMDEMAVGIERIAENSARVSALTNETTDLANDGNITVERALNQMVIIKKTVMQTSEKVEQLSRQSAEIDSIVNVITEISDQTNLLALNAAIEAARAGKHGKGFAVVADEVRKLAEQSRNSAEQIAGLIRTIQTDTMQSVELMNHVNKNVDSGIKVTKETANKFENILGSMHTLNPQMVEISSTALEFSAQTEQIGSAIQRILEIAQQTSEATEEVVSSSDEQLAIMEEVSSSASSLSNMAESLQQLVTKFKL